jgi:histidine kinase
LKNGDPMSGFEKVKGLMKVTNGLKKIKIYAAAAPSNQLAKQYLMEAELKRVSKKDPIALYQKAIETAQKNQILSEEALGNELLGRYYLQNNDLSKTKKHLLRARRVYSKWGAYAKVTLLEQEFALFFKSDEETTQNLPRTGRSSSSSNKTSNAELDLNSLMKASFAISSEIVLGKLLSSLMHVVIENAGAQKGYLLLERQQIWTIVANKNHLDDRTEVLCSIPLKNNSFIPESVVHYVLRTQEHLVIDAIQKDPIFQNDPLVMARPLNSVLSLPILNQGKLIGLLYLENNLNTGVFTEQRVQFLKLLSGQIAVSLENALLFENLEAQVSLRTHELKQKSIELEKSLEVVQFGNDKMQLLIRELNHRVKNNLQIVSSLLSLQSNRVTDESVAAMLREGQARVEAMSLLHQQLYQNDDITTVNMKNFVHALIGNLQFSYGFEGRFDKKIEVSADLWDVDTALPIGLIVNELLSNFFKYVCPAVSKPSLIVTITADRVYYADNGMGFPKNFRPEQSMSFGIRLIMSLAQQLQSTFQFYKEGGLHFKLDLPKVVQNGSNK